jgi:hypothetical protein
MITISADTNSTITATNADHWMIDTGVTVDTAGVGIDASGAVAGREFTIKGLLRSASGPAMQVGDASLADSQTKLRLQQWRGNRCRIGRHKTRSRRRCA